MLCSITFLLYDFAYIGSFISRRKAKNGLANHYILGACACLHVNQI